VKLPVPCPTHYCLAGEGEPCRSSRGNLTFTHSPRMKAARKIGLECWSPTEKELRDAQLAELRWKKARQPKQLSLFEVA